MKNIYLKSSALDELRKRNTFMSKPISTNKNPNYLKLEPYLSNQKFDESYALLSHYIQSNGNAEAEEYKKLLLEQGVNIDQLPSADNFNKAFDIPFSP